MGKIRVKTLGDDEAEKNQKNEAKKRKESKQMVKGAHGGERVVSVGPSEEEMAQMTEAPQETKAPEETKEKKKKVQVKSNKPTRSQKYQTVAKMVDHNKIYSLTEALSLLPQLKIAKFDETVELHVNTHETGVNGTVTLPHGTGKQVRVAVADDKLIANVEKGIIDFDVLVATPEMMPKLSRVAKYLGPRGLMPNPKNGTITKNPEEVAKKYAGGHMTYKTEAKTPIIHMAVGKVSFGEKKLEENIKEVFKSLPQTKVKKVVLKSTMSPALRISIS